jgi:signal transduction histidine kinase
MLLCGVALSARTRRRIIEVNVRVQRIVADDPRERLPCQETDDSFSKLAMIVSGMLDEMETLIRSLAAVGNDIAHATRAPELERGCTSGWLQTKRSRASINRFRSLPPFCGLRKSRTAIDWPALASAHLIREVGDMYEPIAADKGIVLISNSPHQLCAHGDRDLLIEAVANVVDNAVEFTPAEGRWKSDYFAATAKTSYALQVLVPASAN